MENKILLENESLEQIFHLINTESLSLEEKLGESYDDIEIISEKYENTYIRYNYLNIGLEVKEFVKHKKSDDWKISEVETEIKDYIVYKLVKDLDKNILLSMSIFEFILLNTGIIGGDKIDDFLKEKIWDVKI
jgi:hypothetical protein